MESRTHATFIRSIPLMAFVAIASLSMAVFVLRGGADRTARDVISITVMSASVPTLGIVLVAFMMRRNQQDLLSRELDRTLKELANAEKVERNRVARELHDGVCQMLLATRCYLELAKEQRFKSEDEFAKYFSDGIRQLEGAINETRRVSHNLKPALLSSFEFTDAIRHVGREFGERTRIHVRVTGVKGGANERVPPAAQAALIRIVQEALANVEKHSAGSQVLLRFRQKGDSFSLTIADDGCGFDPLAVDQPDSGIGLRNMRERIAEVGGTLTLQPMRKGTKIVAHIPLAPRHRPKDCVARPSSLSA